jgi:hypothetical protein
MTGMLGVIGQEWVATTYDQRTAPVFIRRVVMTMLLLFFPFLTLGAASAADNAFIGQWTIEKVIVAPWSEASTADTKTIPDIPVGTDITVDPALLRIAGLLDCSSPDYKVEPLPADIVFQGGLAFDPKTQTSEPNDEKVMDAASALGFDRINIPTLTNRCSDLALHINSRNELLFAAHNRIYILKRTAP